MCEWLSGSKDSEPALVTLHGKLCLGKVCHLLLGEVEYIRVLLLKA